MALTNIIKKGWKPAVIVVGSGLTYLSYLKDKKADIKVEKKKIESVRPVPKLEIDGLPETIPYLLVGGGTASHSAMRAIRGHDPKAKVLIVTDENHSPYMRPALSKELWFSEPEFSNKLMFKWWNGKEKSIFYEHDEFFIPIRDLDKRETGGVSLIKNIRVTRIDPDNRVAYLNNGQTIKYEKCLLAPGGVPKTIQVLQSAPQQVLDRVVYYRTADDFIKLEKISRTAKRITIVGGGFLGSELSCALGRRAQVDDSSKQIVQIFPEAGNLGKVLPEYLSLWTSERIKEEGVSVIPEVEIKSVDFSNNCVNLELTNGQKLTTDYLVVATGVEPDVELAKSSGLEIDEKTGGYLVNTELEARSNVWVAGDASSFYDVRLGRRRVEHHDHAVVSGRLAGQNMIGSGKPYVHQSMFWSDLGPEIAFEALGIIDSTLPTVAVFAKPSPPSLETNKQQNDAEKEETKDNDNNSKKIQNATTNNDQSKSSSDDTREPKERSQEKMRPPRPDDDYQRGVIFYLRDNRIVGIVLWNLFNRLSIARRLLREDKQFDDFNEVAKLFNVHSED